MIFPLWTYIYGVVFAIIFFIVVWLVSLGLKKSSIIDSAWGAFFLFVSLFYYLYLGRELALNDYLFLGIVALWSFRLSIFLFIRFLKEGEDRRYKEIKKNWKATNISFIKMFVIQGFLAGLLSLPMLLIINFKIQNSYLFFIGLVVSFIFIITESLADYQLFSFKNNEKNKGKICNRGLWKFSRHPNYFSEWMVWVGMSISCLSLEEFGLLGLISSAFMFILLNYVSGIPIIERDARNGLYKKEGEKEYYEKTPAFFPKLF